MFRRNKENKPEKKSTPADYYKEATAWDISDSIQRNKSERRAWIVASCATIIAVAEAVGIVSMLPLKSVEPLIFRVDSSTGIADFVSTLKEVEYFGQEVENKYWLNQYVSAREGWWWDTRDEDRRKVGLLSSSSIQQDYMEFTDPAKNPKAPVVAYGQHLKSTIEPKSISIISSETVNGEHRETALVRFIKRSQRTGEGVTPSHWAATVTFTYRPKTPMSTSDRYINPFGFQVLSYRIDEESAGGL